MSETEVDLKHRLIEARASYYNALSNAYAILANAQRRLHEVIDYKQKLAELETRVGKVDP